MSHYPYFFNNKYPCLRNLEDISNYNESGVKFYDILKKYILNDGESYEVERVEVKSSKEVLIKTKKSNEFLGNCVIWLTDLDIPDLKLRVRYVNDDKSFVCEPFFLEEELDKKIINNTGKVKRAKINWNVLYNDDKYFVIKPNLSTISNCYVFKRLNKKLKDITKFEIGGEDYNVNISFSSFENSEDYCFFVFELWNWNSAISPEENMKNYEVKVINGYWSKPLVYNWGDKNWFIYGDDKYLVLGTFHNNIYYVTSFGLRKNLADKWFSENLNLFSDNDNFYNICSNYASYEFSKPDSFKKKYFLRLSLSELSKNIYEYWDNVFYKRGRAIGGHYYCKEIYYVPPYKIDNGSEFFLDDINIMFVFCLAAYSGGILSYNNNIGACSLNILEVMDDE